MLTSVTTVAGLLPILLERSFQAQIVIPMATSLCFGLLASTVLVLFLTPTMYYIYTLVTAGGAHAPEDDVEWESPIETLVASGAGQNDASDDAAGSSADNTTGNGDVAERPIKSPHVDWS